MERFANNEYVEDYSRQERLIRSQMRSMKEEGLEEGKIVGLEIGKQNGLQEGKESASFEIAKKMLLENESLDKIRLYTELTDEEIEKLKEDLKQ